MTDINTPGDDSKTESECSAENAPSAAESTMSGNGTETWLNWERVRGPLAWIGGVMILISGIGALSESGFNAVIAGFLLIALGIFMLPPGRARIESYIDHTIPTKVAVIIGVVLFFAGAGMLPESDADTSSDIESDAPADDAAAAADAAESDSGGDESGASDEMGAAEEKSGSAGAAMLESLLNERGYASVEVISSVGRLSVSYTSRATTEDEVLTEMAEFAMAYAAVVDEGYDVENMHVSIQNQRGEVAGTYEVKKEDAQAFADGEISREEFATRILLSGEAQGES